MGGRRTNLSRKLLGELNSETWGVNRAEVIGRRSSSGDWGESCVEEFGIRVGRKLRWGLENAHLENAGVKMISDSEDCRKDDCN